MRLRLFRTALLVVLLAFGVGCNQQKAPAPDPNIIETKLADGRVLHYTKQQLAEAQSWGYTKADYDTSLSVGETHDAIIQVAKQRYWNQLHPGTPPPDITPPPQWKANN